MLTREKKKEHNTTRQAGSIQPARNGCCLQLHGGHAHTLTYTSTVAQKCTCTLLQLHTLAGKGSAAPQSDHMVQAGVRLHSQPGWLKSDRISLSHTSTVHELRAMPACMSPKQAPAQRDSRESPSRACVESHPS
jgi:hypothetical protein